MKNVYTFKDAELNEKAKKIISRNKNKLLKIFENLSK